MTNVEKLVKFIKENNLNFKEEGSGLNSACTILSGYALYIDEENIEGDELCNAIRIIFPDFTDEDELERVFNYCQDNNYQLWWKEKENRKLYKI
jgi:hypothetical protein